ncbi:ABC transporter substrate-binding protein [Bengtsoniella intestinalis]|uniref:ABC transporter substrate-binding protein n=1 Tax=Bengtsoniella intestinalis TaxID=3073143 RepID=UPI00391EE4C4
MFNLKKLLTATMALTLTFSLTACASSEDTADETLQIGILQLVENGAFTDMYEGFMAQMDALGYGEDAVTYTYQIAQGDTTTLNTIAQDMIDDNMDVIVTIATPATQAVVNMETDIPVFYISVGDPTGAGVITDVEHPDKNATGTSNAIPVDEMFNLADTLTPGIETYGLVYCTNEVNAVTTIENAKVYLEANGIPYIEKIVTSSNEVQQATQALVGNVDAIFCPNDSVVQTAMPQLAEVAKEAGIPVYGSSAVMVADGAFATISIDDMTIGSMTADMVAAYLGGTAVTDIPAVTVSEFVTVINQTTTDALGISLSDDVLGAALLVE